MLSPTLKSKLCLKNAKNSKPQSFYPPKPQLKHAKINLNQPESGRKRTFLSHEQSKSKKDEDIDRAFAEFGSPIWVRARHGAGGKGSTPADNRETAVSWIKYWKSRNVDWEFIAQEHLPGRNIAFHSLWKDGEIVTSMARERLEYIYAYLAPSGITGTPAVQRTVHDDRVNKTSTEAVLSIDSKFSGIASVDLKENAAGVPCVTEINPGRMFTTSYFFSYASKVIRKDFCANIPYLYTKLAFKESVPEMPKYNILPADVYWIRHMDAPARLVKDGKVLGAMYS